METEQRRSTHPLLGCFLIGLALGVVAVVGLGIVITVKSNQAKPIVVTNHMKQIGIALSDYHDYYGAYPPAYTVDEDGQPLHSWRVLILPFMFQDYLYESFDLDEPWDSPGNMALIQFMPDTFASPYLRNEPGKTTFLALAGPNTALNTTSPVSQSVITTNEGRAIMVVDDIENPVVWTQPDDISPEEFARLTSVDERPAAGIHVMLSNPESLMLDVQIYHDEDLPRLRSLMAITASEDEVPQNE